MLQPKVSGGGGMSRDEQLTALAQDILADTEHHQLRAGAEQYPVQYEESMNTVLQQEIIKYNKLLPVINASLKELIKAIKGTVVMSDCSRTWRRDVLQGAQDVGGGAGTRFDQHAGVVARRPGDADRVSD